MENFNELTPLSAPNRDASSIVSHAFEIFKKTFLYGLVAMLIYGAVNFVIQLLTGFDSRELSEQLRDQTALGRAVDYRDILALPGFMLYTGINIFGGILLSPIFASLVYVAYKAHHNQRIELSDIFFGYKQNFMNIVIYSFLYQIVITICLLMCVLPALFVLPFFIFGYPILIFEKASAIDAIKKSFNMVQQNYGTVLLTAILAWLISFAGIIFCCIGVIFTAPFLYNVMYSAYCAYFGTPKQLN